VHPLDEVEAVEFLEKFRQVRGGQDSILDARLIHYPRRGSKSIVPLRIYSGWQGSALLLRVEMESDEFSPGSRFLFQGGENPAGWVWRPGGEIEALPPEELLGPLIEGMKLSAFDLTAPYVDWVDVEYDGPDRVGDSPVHWYRFSPTPEWSDRMESVGIVAVRVAIDARFDAPVRVEYLDSGDDVLRSLEVRSFKQVKDTWIVRRLEGFDDVTRDRSELRVDEAEVELTLPYGIFSPDTLSMEAISISD
tara:strand:- start:27185 stop:27931 length:747 start_codon:yes stop_codon:yes gene_type:complete